MAMGIGKDIRYVYPYGYLTNPLWPWANLKENNQRTCMITFNSPYEIVVNGLMKILFDFQSLI